MTFPAANALSENISFDYVEGTFTSSTIDPGASPHELEGNGIGFALSLSFNPHYAITLAVLATTFNTFQNNPADTVKTTNLGITGHTEIAEATEIFGNASLLKTEITTTDGDTTSMDKEVGYNLKIGLRHFVHKSIELEFGASHLYALDYPANTLNAEVRLYMRKQLSLGLAYITGDNKDSLSLNGRLNF